MDSNGGPRRESANGLGHLIRMRALGPAEWPSHSSLAELQSGTQPKYIHAFVAEALNEAEQFMTAYMKQFKSKGNKKSAPSTAPVELKEKQIPGHRTGNGKPTPTENWFARTSIHENKSENGTASWDEFNHGLRTNHSQHEKAYTPTVIDDHKVIDWASALAEGSNVDVNGWTDLTAAVMEMCHKTPFPVSNRVFPVLIITAKKGDVFLVIQIPVSTDGVSTSKYQHSSEVKGMYCSIERCELKEGGEKVEWQMATASDAKGSIPMVLQKMKVPEAVVHDVGLFIKWCAEQRG